MMANRFCKNLCVNKKGLQRYFNNLDKHVQNLFLAKEDLSKKCDALRKLINAVKTKVKKEEIDKMRKKAV